MIDSFFFATKAIIDFQGKILILREASTNPDGTNTGKYDLPGGRLEPGEHPNEALKREVFEETGLEITIGKPMALGEWRPMVRGKQWQIVAVYMACTTNSPDVTLSHEHDEYKWVAKEELHLYPLMDNIKTILLSTKNSQ